GRRDREAAVAARDARVQLARRRRVGVLHREGERGPRPGRNAVELERTRGLDVEDAGGAAWRGALRLPDDRYGIRGGRLSVAHRELHGDDVARLVAEDVAGTHLVRRRPVAEVPVVGELVEVGIRALRPVELDGDAGQGDVARGS